MSTTDPAADLAGWLSQPVAKPHEISQFLDSLTHVERVAAVRSLNRAQQKKLYECADGFRPVTLSDLVPSTCDDLQTVRHFGKNTLPAFTHFEKRFCRPAGADREQPAELFGFNFQTMAPITGPGYFIAVNDDARHEVLVDYRRVPSEPPPGWPPVRDNEGIPARFVYGFMVDTLRGVSNHVSIGSAAKKGKDLGSWFVLCREQ